MIYDYDDIMIYNVYIGRVPLSKRPSLPNASTTASHQEVGRNLAGGPDLAQRAALVAQHQAPALRGLFAHAHLGRRLPRGQPSQLVALEAVGGQDHLEALHGSVRRRHGLKTGLKHLSPMGNEAKTRLETIFFYYLVTSHRKCCGLDF